LGVHAVGASDGATARRVSQRWNVRFFDQMKKMLMDEPDRPSQAQVATEFGMT
jgi:hypothetical protein